MCAEITFNIFSTECWVLFKLWIRCSNFIYIIIQINNIIFFYLILRSITEPIVRIQKIIIKIIINLKQTIQILNGTTFPQIQGNESQKVIKGNCTSKKSLQKKLKTGRRQPENTTKREFICRIEQGSLFTNVTMMFWGLSFTTTWYKGIRRPVLQQRGEKMAIRVWKGSLLKKSLPGIVKITGRT